MMKISKSQWILLAAIVILAGINLVFFLRIIGTARLSETPEESTGIPVQEEVIDEEKHTAMSGCIINHPTITYDPNALYKMSPPIKTILCLDDINPKLGSPILFKFLVQPLVEAPNTTVTIELPPQVILLEGKLTWNGNLNANDQYVHQLIIQIDELPEPIAIRSIDDYPKLAAIKATTESVFPGGSSFGGGGFLFLRATADGIIEASENPFVTAPVQNQSPARRINDISLIEPLVSRY